MRTNQGDYDPADFTPNDINTWSNVETLDDGGVTVGAYEAMDEAQVNMQFRIPFTGAEAGTYEGDVTFSMYS
ncbi:MAG: hypothetical protein ACOC4G_14585, partial [Bacillota bacterium]